MADPRSYFEPPMDTPVRLSPRNVSDIKRLLNLVTSSGSSRPRSQREWANRAKVKLPRRSGERNVGTAASSRAEFRTVNVWRARLGNFLVLYVGDRSESRNTISRLAEMTGAPMTTMLRWLDYPARRSRVCHVSGTARSLSPGIGILCLAECGQGIAGIRYEETARRYQRTYCCA
jgi:hypothetical protein